jgi:hypothetical protein
LLEDLEALELRRRVARVCCELLQHQTIQAKPSLARAVNRLVGDELLHDCEVFFDRLIQYSLVH